MTKRIILTCLTLCILPSFSTASPVDVVAPETAGMSSERLAALKERLQKELADEKTGGIQVLVSRRGKVVMYENLGFANVESKVPMSDQSLFRIYSMTKPVVGVAMMMLYEEGVYSLSDPLDMHIPEFADLQVYAGTGDDGQMILEDPAPDPTMHDLLRHTAGFTYGIFGDTPVDRLYLEKDIGRYDDSLQNLIDKLASTPLLYQPGEKWVYSYAVDVQGYLIEKWTGKSVGEFLRERLFEPLGMDQTMAWVPQDKAHLLANIYTHDEDGARTKFEGDLAERHFGPPGGFNGGSQLISTSDDYWRFSQMLLNGGEFDGVRYLSPTTIDMMTSNRLPDSTETFFRGSGFGLNFSVVTDPALVNYPANKGEYSWGGLATTLFWIDPQEDLVVIMLTQYLPWNEPYFRDLMHRMVHAAIID